MDRGVSRYKLISIGGGGALKKMLTSVFALKVHAHITGQETSFHSAGCSHILRVSNMRWKSHPNNKEVSR